MGDSEPGGAPPPAALKPSSPEGLLDQRKTSEKAGKTAKSAEIVELVEARPSSPKSAKKKKPKEAAAGESKSSDEKLPTKSKKKNPKATEQGEGKEGKEEKKKKKKSKKETTEKQEASPDGAAKEDKGGSPATPLKITIPESPTNAADPTKIVETPRPWDSESYVSLAKHPDGRQLRFKRILLQTEMGEIGTLLKVGAESPTGQSVNPQNVFNPDDESIIDFDQYRFGYTGTTNPEGQPHGKGKMVWKDDSTYEGDWINGRREGYGVQRWASGDRYEGHWEQDKQKGEGAMFYASDYGPDKFYAAFEYLPSKPASVTSGYDRYEPLGVAPVDAVEADGDSTTGALSHKDRLLEGDMRSVHEGGSEEQHRRRFPADRPEALVPILLTQGQGNNHDDDDLASLGMESAGGGEGLHVYTGLTTVPGAGAGAGADANSVDGTATATATATADGASATATADLGHLYREDSVYDGSRVRVMKSSHRSYPRDPASWDYQHSEGNRYVGERNAAFQREGRGKFRFRDGSFYDGQWHGDKMHGVGWLTQPRMGAAFVIKKTDGRVLSPSPSSPSRQGQPNPNPNPSQGTGTGTPGSPGMGASRRESLGAGFEAGGGGLDSPFNRGTGTGTGTGTGGDPFAESTRGLPTQQPPSSPSSKVDKGNKMSDRRADSPPGRARDMGLTYNESRTLALEREEEEEKRKQAAAGSAPAKGRKESLASPFQGMSASERSAARRESQALRRQSASPGGLGSPGGIVSLASPNAFSEILEEGDTKVVLRDDYKGDFCEDKKHGSGRMRYADGSVYYGAWERDQRHGYGEYYYANGDKYCGHWQHDLMHTPLIAKETDADQGLYIWANGDHYKGGFAEGKKFGEGRKDYVADGSIEQGHWQYDSFEGYPFSPDLDFEGQYNMTRGSYMYGKKQGYGRKVWRDGSKRIYDGQWDCDRMHGHAVKMVNFFGLSSVYEGQIVADGVPHGNGKMRYPNGDEYHGQWERGKRHGKGEYRAKDGQVRTGQWFQGRGMFRMGGIRFS